VQQVFGHVAAEESFVLGEVSVVVPDLVCGVGLEDQDALVDGLVVALGLEVTLECGVVGDDCVHLLDEVLVEQLQDFVALEALGFLVVL